MAAACVYVMNLDKPPYDRHTQPMLSQINVGRGEHITIRQVAEAIGKTVGYQGEITFDSSKPDGTPRKLLDSSRINSLGWTAQIGLETGLNTAYQDFLINYVFKN